MSPKCPPKPRKQHVRSTGLLKKFLIQKYSTKMTTATSGDLSPLAIKCMEFCQALTSQGTKFSFNLTTGPQFSFSLDTKDLETSTSVVTEKVKRKKWSPSDVRRNQRRRLEFLRRKTEGEKEDNSTDETEELLSPEKERSPQAPGELQISPNHVQREEINLSEEEGASPACKAPAPTSTWNTTPLGAPPAPRLCGLTLWSRGPKCDKTFNRESDWRCHAHEVHHLCMKVLKRDPAPCPYPGH